MNSQREGSRWTYIAAAVGSVPLVMRRRNLFALLLLPLVRGVAIAQSRQSETPEREIVFVCEHGAALSVVAAAYFNKLAQEQQLRLHAVPRGATPQEGLSLQAISGLKRDGLAPEIQKPLGLSLVELAGARRVVTFFPIPSEFSSLTPVENWEDVTWGPGSYENSRDAIVGHMQDLLSRLKAEIKAN